MLSRKYYNIIAKILGESENLDQVVRELADFMAYDNPSFDRSKFTHAIMRAKESREQAKMGAIY